MQDAQNGRPARPQRAKRRGVRLRYVEPLSDARTPLAVFFRILLVQCMETSGRAGQIDPGGIELEERSDKVFPGPGH